MNDPDTRWKQRFSQFEKAFALLQSAMTIEHPFIVERAGLIQFFEMTFEIGWKLLKDFLEAEGYVINSPRSAIKQAFQSQLITAGHEWISALDDRNLTTHTYNEEIAELVERKIRQDYYPLLLSLRQTFVQKTGV